MADEYIKREAALKGICSGCFAGNMEENCFCGIPCDDYKRISKLPAADVAPVVRCKDCKHGTRLVCDLAGNEGIECRHGNIAHRLDWFCADGAKNEP